MSATAPVIYVSASQVRSHRECKRKIGHRYNDKREDKGSEKAWFGKEAHGVAEHYLKTGAIPSETTISGIAIRKLMGEDWLPTPSAHIVSEGEINFDSGLPGIILSGYIDILDPRGLPEVNDVKTTSDKQYALKPEEFDEDPQVLIYAKYVADRWGGGWAKMRWLYVFIKWTKTPEGVYVPVGVKGRHKVETIINVNSRGFQEKWARLLDDVAEIAAARRAKVTANLLEMDTSSCYKYGPCAFLKWCDRPAGASLTSRLKKMWKAQKRTTKKEEVEDVSAFNDRLKAMQAAKQAKEGGAVSAEKETPKAAAVETKAEPAQAKAGPDKALSALEQLKAKAAASKVNPPEQKPKISAEALERNKDLISPEEVAEIEVVETHKADAETQAASEPAKKTRTGKKDTAPKSSTGIQPNRIVIFDGAFTKVTNHSVPTMVQLHEILQELTEHINTEHQVSHWSHLDFGKGRGLLAALLDEVLTGGKYDYATILADSSSAETQAVRDVLVKHAATVIQGY